MFKFLTRLPAQLATVLLIAQAGAYYSISRVEVIPDIRPWAEFPTQLDEWTVVGESQMDPEIFARLQPDDYLNRDYFAAARGTNVNLFIGYFKTLRTGLAPHSPQACLPGAGWRPVSAEIASLPVSIDPRSIPVNLFLVEQYNTRMLVLYWYQQRERSFASESAFQFYAIPELLLHGRTDVALVRVITLVPGEDLERAKKTTTRFAQIIYPHVRARMQ